MTHLNASRISIGALIIIAALLFDNPARQALEAFSTSYGWFTAILLFLLFFLIPVGHLGDMLNVLFGALLVLFAFGLLPQVQTAFQDGSIVFVALFLIVVAIYMNKATRIGF